MPTPLPPSVPEEATAPAAHGQGSGLGEWPGLLQLLFMLLAAAFALGLGGCAQAVPPVAQGSIASTACLQAEHLEERPARPLRI